MWGESGVGESSGGVTSGGRARETCLSSYYFYSRAKITVDPSKVQFFHWLNPIFYSHQSLRNKCLKKVFKHLNT